MNVFYPNLCHNTACYKGTVLYLGDNCIQNFHLGRYIVGYMVGN